ncbi:hypothetical protein PTNB85_00265 [Pyrenophora teres f. teres]|nr:hypothetical protein PTNB85_00265 [Pyrenophora teres f. teres]
MSSSRSESGQSDSGVDNGDLKTNILLMLAESGAARAREQVQTLQRTNDRLHVEVGSLRARLNDAEARAQGATDSGNLIRELKTMLAVERNEKEQAIKDKVQQSDELSAQLSAGAEAARKSTEAKVHLETTIENQRRKIDNSEQKLTIVKNDRDWYRAEHSQMLEARNTQNNNRAPEIDHLKSEVTRLTQYAKNVKENSQNKVHKLKREIATQVAHLDLFNIRIYTCRHHDLSNMHNDATVTRERDARIAGNDIFKNWMKDEEFLTEYKAARQHVISHHVAHEMTGVGRGDFSSSVRHYIIRRDEQGGIVSDYH